MLVTSWQVTGMMHREVSPPSKKEHDHHLVAQHS